MHALVSFCLTAIVIIICLGLYLLPALIAVIRRAPDTAMIVLLNILLGWTLIGWVACGALAFRKVAPTVQVINQVHVQGDHPGSGNHAADRQ